MFCFSSGVILQEGLYSIPSDGGFAMELENILIWCVIGLVAGWLASFVLGGGGLIRYLVSGLIGAFVGGFLFNLLGIDINLGNAIVNQIVVATVGAIVVVFVARRIS